MFEFLQMARNYLRMAWLYRWLAVGISLVAVVGGWAYVYSLADQYKVSAKLYLDSSSMLRPLLRGLAINSNALQDSAVMLERTLLTRPNLEEIARSADLDLNAETPEDFDRIVMRLGKSISVVKTKRQHIYDITYQDPEPQRAKTIVDEILNTFLESALGDSRKDTAVTQRFLDEQLAEYESRLIAAEERLKEFKQRNIGVMPGSQGGFFARLQQAQTDLKTAQLELQEAQNRLQQLKSNQKSGAGSGAGMGGDMFSTDFGFGGESGLSSPELEEIDARIGDYEARIEDLLLVYTEKYPDVVTFRQRIAELEKQREEELIRLEEQALANPSSGEDDFGPTVDPYEQQMKLQVADAASVVAGLQTRVKEYQNRVTSLEQRVDIVPEVEAELARLNRDYNINKTQYNELLKRREQAYLSQEADQTQDDVKIRILDPPRVPFAPSGPNRILLLSVVMLLALGLGAGLAVLMSQLNRRVIDTTDLKEITGLNVFGAVGMKHNRQHIRQRRAEIAVFATSLFVLFSAYIVQILLYQSGILIHEKLGALVRTVI